ncbi:MAG: HNH endonuclease [Terriglobia bacterium]
MGYTAAALDSGPCGGLRLVRLTIGHIKDKSKGGDDSPQNLRAICDSCNEGLQNTAPQKPDRIHLLSQVPGPRLTIRKRCWIGYQRNFGRSSKVHRSCSECQIKNPKAQTDPLPKN